MDKPNVVTITDSAGNTFTMLEQSEYGHIAYSQMPGGDFMFVGKVKGCPSPTYDRIVELEKALREIANQAGAPTMSYAPEVEAEERGKSLEWIARRAASALKNTGEKHARSSGV